MKVCKGYKTELDLNDRQKTWCVKHTGAARFAYNWGLARKIEAYRVTGKSESAIELHRALNALKKGELAWMYEVSKCAPQEALRDLDQAFAHFFRRVKEGKTQAGFPRFKSRTHFRPKENRWALTWASTLWRLALMGDSLPIHVL